jgi:hypothetical protein
MDDHHLSTDEQQSVHLDLDDPAMPKGLNGWIPLFKRLLALPRYFVRTFALIAMIVAWVAILVTGRYPRGGLFDYIERVDPLGATA